MDARKHYPALREAQPEMFQAFLNFNAQVFEKESALPRKVKEPIALAVAHTTQCPYCIESHVKAAKKAGAGDEPRYLVIGMISGKHWTGVITYRGEKAGIISMRRSRKEEVEIYEG